MSSMKFSPKAMLVRMPAAYWKSKRFLEQGGALPNVDDERFAPPTSEPVDRPTAAPK
jgi:hypothetical protein